MSLSSKEVPWFLKQGHWAVGAGVSEGLQTGLDLQDLEKMCTGFSCCSGRELLLLGQRSKAGGHGKQAENAKETNRSKSLFPLLTLQSLCSPPMGRTWQRGAAGKGEMWLLNPSPASYSWVWKGGVWNWEATSCYLAYWAIIVQIHSFVMDFYSSSVFWKQ